MKPIVSSERIRNEVMSDASAISLLHLAAFGHNNEALLVEALRRDGDIVSELSFVSEKDGRIIGHALFTTLSTVEFRPFLGVALAPVAVFPGYQKQGVGTRMIEAALKRVKTLGFHVAVVLGDPAYYKRFGFSVELGKKIACRYSGPHLMAMELEEGALKNVERLEVAYPKAFG